MQTFNSKVKENRIQAGKSAANAVITQMSNAGNEIDKRLSDTVKTVIIAALATGSINDFNNVTDGIFVNFEKDIKRIIYNKTRNVGEISKKYNEYTENTTYELEKFIANSDLSEKLHNTTANFKKQMKLYTAVALSAEKGPADVIKEYIMYKKTPYNSPLIISNKEKGINIQEPKGKGNYKSVYADLNRIMTFIVFSAYNFLNRFIWKKNKNIIGYSTYRNSSYPCEICDSLAGRVFPLTEIVIPAHGHCVCATYPIFSTDLPIYQ